MPALDLSPLAAIGAEITAAQAALAASGAEAKRLADLAAQDANASRREPKPPPHRPAPTAPA
jgi:hypothetical protein